MDTRLRVYDDERFFFGSSMLILYRACKPQEIGMWGRDVEREQYLQHSMQTLELPIKKSRSRFVRVIT